MAEQTVRAESNIDALNERVFKDHLEGLVRELAGDGADAMRLFVPKGETLAMTRAVKHSEPISIDDVIEAVVGIGPIESARIRETFGASDPADYPLFRHTGTGIFGPTHARIFAKHDSVGSLTDFVEKGGSAEGRSIFGRGYMKFPWKGSLLFRHSVRGSKGSPFMAATYAVLRVAVAARVAEYKALVSADLEARKAAYKLDE